MFRDRASKWLNPLSWFDSILQVVGALFRGIFEFFGLVSPPPTDWHENIQVADVEVAEKDAREAQAAADELVAEMTPAQVVHAYCVATEEARKTMDLSKLSVEQQDWLMRLSTADLVMLGGSGEAACGRSVDALKLIVSRSKLRIPVMAAAPQVLPVAGAEPLTEDEKREFLVQFIKARHSELLLAPGAGNPNPKLSPSSVGTLH